MPVIAPPLKATSSAGPMPLVAACAVRTLARTEMFMPMKPQAPESTAPSTKPAAVVPSRKIAIRIASTTPTMRDGLVLARQVGGRALLDRRGDLLHARVARALAEDPASLHEAVDDRGQAAGQGDVERRRGGDQESSFLVRFVGFVRELAGSSAGVRERTRSGKPANVKGCAGPRQSARRPSGRRARPVAHNIGASASHATPP